MQTNETRITYTAVMWTSIWPLLLVSLLIGLVAQQMSPGERSGIGSGWILWGTVFAGMYARRPVFTFTEAFAMSARWAVPINAALAAAACVFFISALGADADVLVLVIAAAASTAVGCAVWAFFIVRKGRNLAGAGARPGRHGGQEQASTSAAHRTPTVGGSPATLAGRIAGIVSTGWGRLGLVAWGAWLIWRWSEVDDQAAYYGWSGEDYVKLVVQGVVGPLGAAAVAWWVRLGFLPPSEREARQQRTALDGAGAISSATSEYTLETEMNAASAAPPAPSAPRDAVKQPSYEELIARVAAMNAPRTATNGGPRTVELGRSPRADPARQSEYEALVERVADMNDGPQGGRRDD